jgi:hypothetical protein
MRRALSYLAATTIGGVGAAFLVVDSALWIRTLAGAIVGAGIWGSVRFWLTHRSRFGGFIAALLLMMIWGSVFGLAAAVFPFCVDNNGNSASCPPDEIAGSAFSGALIIVTAIVAAGPLLFIVGQRHRMMNGIRWSHIRWITRQERT